MQYFMHSHSNGLVEWMHQQMRAALKAQLATPSWCDQLPIFLLGLCTTLKEGLAGSTAVLVHDTTLCLPGKFLMPTSLPTKLCAVTDLFHK